MILGSSKNVSLLNPSVTDLTSNITTLLDSNNKNILSSTAQSSMLDKLGNTFLATGKELLAVEASFEFENKKYATVLQNISGNFIPVKLYEESNDKLIETPIFDFKNGDKDGKYINPNDLNRFVSALVFKFDKDIFGDFIKIDNEFNAFINKNIYQKPNKEFGLNINVDNVNDWSKLIQKNIILSDKFENNLNAKLSKMYPYLDEDRRKDTVNSFTTMLSNGNFNITPDAITKISLSDLITLSRISSGQLSSRKLDDFSSRNKMMENFLKEGSFKNLDCKATNYILSGVTKNSIPILYESQILKKQTNLKDFAEKSKIELENLKQKLQNDKTISSLIKYINEDKEQRTLTALNLFRNSLFISNEGKLDYDRISKTYPVIEQLLKNAEFKPLLKQLNYVKNKENITQEELRKTYISAVDKSSLNLRATLTSSLEVKPTDTNASKLYNSQDGQKLPIDIFYTKNPLLTEISKEIGIYKTGEALSMGTGISISGITEVEEKDSSLIAKKAIRFSRFSNGLEQMGDIISNLDACNEKGEIFYLKEDNGKTIESSFKVNAKRDIENLVKQFNKTFINPHTQEVYLSKSNVGSSLQPVISQMNDILRVTSDTDTIIKKAKEIIKENDIMQELVKVGSLKKVTFNQNQNMSFNYLNANHLNKHFATSKPLEDIYIKSPKAPAYLTDKDEILSLANKAAKSFMLSLKNNLEVFSHVIKNDKDIDTKISNIQKISNGNSIYDETLTQDKKDALLQSKKLSLLEYVNSIGSIIASKSSGNLKVPTVNYWLDKSIKADYYPLSEKKVSKNGSEYTIQTTSDKEILKTINEKVKKDAPVFDAIKQKIENDFSKKIENGSRATLSYENYNPDTAIKSEPKVENKTITEKVEIQEIPMEILDNNLPIANNTNKKEVDDIEIPNNNLVDDEIDMQINEIEEVENLDIDFPKLDGIEIEYDDFGPSR